MSKTEILHAAKHGLLFAAGVIVTFFGLALPVIVLRPGAFAGSSPAQILSSLAPHSLDDLLVPWTTYLLNIVAQILIFRTVKKHPSAIYLIALAVGWSAYYWWLALRTA